MRDKVRNRVWLLCSLAPALWVAGCEQGARNPAVTVASTSEAAGHSEQPWFVDVTAQCGVDFVHVSGAAGQFLFPEIMGGGAALVDLNNSGYLDLYLVQSGYITTSDDDQQPANQLYRNVGPDVPGAFVNVSIASGADDRGYGMGVAAGDYDNDGFIDLYITNVGPNTMLRNLGDMRFENVTAQTGTGDPGWGTSAAFVDFDHNGLLDLFVTNYVIWSVHSDLRCINAIGERDYCSPNSYNAPQPDVLYRNLGDGTFDDVSSAAGIRAAYGNGLGVVCADFNANGWIDIYVANDMNENQLWINQGNGRFRDMAKVLGVAVDRHGDPKAGMGTHAADVFDNGMPDILVVNLRNQSDSFHRNEGRYFSDDTTMVGLGSVTRPYTRFGVALHDFDNDGYLDYYVANGRVITSPEVPQWGEDAYAEPNILLRGSAQPRFTEVLPRGGTDPVIARTARAAAFGDIDGDGSIDIVVVNRDAPVNLLRNILGRHNNSISFRVIDQHGRDALHATLKITFADRTIWRDVQSAYSYQAANDPRVTVGLGEVDRVDSVQVTWPDRTVETFGPFNAGQVVTLRHGMGTPRTAR